MRSKRCCIAKKLAALLLIAGILTGCGRNLSKTPAVRSSETPDTAQSSALTASDNHFVLITIADCYPADSSVVAVADSRNKLPTFSSASSMKEYYANAMTLTYDEDLGGYGVLLDEGNYEISLICDAPDVTYSQSRFISVDSEHFYYHVRFTEQAYTDFD